MEKKNNITNIIFGLALAVLLFGTGFKVGELKGQGGAVRNVMDPQQMISGPSNIKGFDSALFNEAINTFNQKYVDRSKLDSKKEFYGSIKGVIASVGDPYTFFLTPEENKASREQLGGKFEGIGAQLGMRDGHIMIIAPLKNSPAAKAGIIAGDFITKVDGANTKAWSLNDAVSKIRGKSGTSVKLTLVRNGQEFERSLVRAEVQVDSVELTYMDQAAIIHVNQFSENTNDQWDQAIEQVVTKWKDHSIKGLVVDLRDNPGGFLDSAVYLASDFLPQGKLIVKQESTVNGNHEYSVTRDARLPDIPVTVLINRGSASASEIFSGALHDHKRAKLVGEKSFGKGSVQEALDLRGGAGLHVTVAKWILPSGQWIMGKGITPDVAVQNKIPDIDATNTPTEEQLRQSDDQLKKAIELLK